MFFIPGDQRPYIGNYYIDPPEKRVRVCSEERLDESGGVLAIEREALDAKEGERG